MIAGAGGAAAAAGAAVWGTGAYRHRRGDTALDRIRRVCSSPLLATPQVRTMVLGPSSGEEADAAADPPKPGETLAAATLGGRGGSVRSSVSPGRSYVSGSGGSGSAATPLLHAAEPSSDVTVAQPMAPMPSPLLGAGDAAGGGGGDDESEQEEMTISSSSAACATGAPALPRIAAWLDCAVREDERRLIWERIVAVLGADARGVRLLRRAKDGWTHDPYPSDRVVAVRDAVLQACTAPVVTGGVDDGGVESVTTRDDGLYVNFHEGVRLSLGQKYVIVSRYRQKISRRKRENMRVTLVDDAYRAQEGGETEAATC